ncbi:hypothetical protein [Hymenobacter terricola]|uniref:hypothetical protein n=1 Tax=Hymenobacter terricola TaxID=2819236 RepID=UPI001B30D62E|nr:hypothetical protein [Hymenobacter terricola]
MKTKSVIFALFISLFMLGGCVASGPGYSAGYGYYPSAQPYYGYGYGRPYYAPRPVIVARPYYRGGYGGGYHGEGGHGGYHGGGNGGYNGGGGNHGGGGHGRGR